MDEGEENQMGSADFRQSYGPLRLLLSGFIITDLIKVESFCTGCGTDSR